MKIPASGELYGRSVEEWIGRTPDSVAPPHVQLRILLRQSRRCAITGHGKGKNEMFQCDHIIRLKDKGENRESNLQMILVAAHKVKTAIEREHGAKVDRLQKKHLGIDRPKQKIASRGFRQFQSNTVDVKDERG